MTLEKNREKTILGLVAKETPFRFHSKNYGKMLETFKDRTFF